MKAATITRAYLTRTTAGAPGYHPGKAERYMRRTSNRWTILLTLAEVMKGSKK